MDILDAYRPFCTSLGSFEASNVKLLLREYDSLFIDIQKFHPCKRLAGFV